MSNEANILKTISQFAMQMNAATTEEALLDLGAKAGVEVTGTDHSGLVLFNEDMLTGVVASEYPEQGLRGMTLSVSNNPFFSEDAVNYEAVIVPDIAQAENLREDMRAQLMNSNIGATLIIPLIGLKGDLMGSIGLDVYGQPRQFTETEIRAAQMVASQVAVGVQNLRLLHAAQHRAEQLQRIADFNRNTQSSLNLTQMIDASLASVPSLLSVTHVALVLRDDVRDEVTLVSGWNESNEVRTPLETTTTALEAGTTTHHVLSVGQYLYVPNLPEQSQLVYPYPNTVQTLLVIPLANRGQVFGVLNVGTPATDAYPDTDIALFQQMVNQMSVAIDNARTYTQSRRVAQNKTLANEISVQFQRQNDINKMVDLALREVGRAIGAKRGRIRLQTTRDDDSNGT